MPESFKPRTDPTPEARQLIKEGRGWRCGLEAVTRARDVVKHEVEELGNDHILEEIQDVFDEPRTPTLPDAIHLLDLYYGEDSAAIWLGKKHAVEELYCQEGEEAFDVPIKDAILISDLGYDGQLFLFPESPRQARLLRKS